MTNRQLKYVTGQVDSMIFFISGIVCGLGGHGGFATLLIALAFLPQKKLKDEREE